MAMGYRLSAFFILTAGFVVQSFPVMAQQCQMGPSCSALSNRVNAYVSRVSGGGVAGVHDASLKAYCINRVGAEAARRCASEQRKSGQNACASQATAQAAEFDRVAAKAKSAASATAARANWHVVCQWR